MGTPTASPLIYRSYSRRTPDGSRESWDDICKRTNAALVALGKLPNNLGLDILRLQLLKQVMPSGRWMWIGGTAWAEKPDNVYGGYNCASITIKCWADFGLLMNLAMQGTGTGAILEDNIRQLPSIRNRLQIVFDGEIGKAPAQFRREKTNLFMAAVDRVCITVGDSREGWVDAYRLLLDLASDDKLSDEIHVTVDLSSVRPAGTPLKGFGGTANPVRLPTMFTRVAEIIGGAIGRQLTAVECCLLIDEAAACVVAGNIRRCLASHVHINMADGTTKSIGNIKVGDLVKTPGGQQAVTDKFDQGAQQCWRITLENDTVLEATSMHQFAVYRPAETDICYEWVKVIDLDMTDSLMTHNGTELVPVKIRLMSPPKEFRDTWDIEVAEEHCFFAEGILSHNSAGMRQGSGGDTGFVSAKDNLWQQDATGNWSIDPKRDALRMANHTRVYHTKPTLTEVTDAVRKQFYSGEGAIQYAPEAIARANADLLYNQGWKTQFIRAYESGKGREFLQVNFDPAMPERELSHRLGRYGLNPCGEILGEDFLCNLSEVHLNTLDPTQEHQQTEAFAAAGIIAATLLHQKFPHERQQYSRDIDPIVGVSFTGLFDFFVTAFGVDWLKWWEAGRSPDYPGAVRFIYGERQYLNRWKVAVIDAVSDYCNKHGLRVPNRCTTVQPAGSKSLITGASPGWHPPKAQRYIRRMTFRKDDPIALACIDMGYSVIPSPSDKDSNGVLLNDPFDPRCTEWLVEFPVAVSWADLPGADQIAIEKFSAAAQFDFYMQVQQYYTMHNTSSTIELREDEIEPLAQVIHDAIENGDGYISAALLARTDACFPRMPFEPIDKTTYDNMMVWVQTRATQTDFHTALARHDNAAEELQGPAGCDSDKCTMPEKKPG